MRRYRFLKPGLRMMLCLAAVAIGSAAYAEAEPAQVQQDVVKIASLDDAKWLRVEVIRADEDVVEFKLRALRQKKPLAGYEVTLHVDEGAMQGAQLPMDFRPSQGGFESRAMTLPRAILAASRVVMKELPGSFEYGWREAGGTTYEIELLPVIEKAVADKLAADEAQRILTARLRARVLAERAERDRKRAAGEIEEGVLEAPELELWQLSTTVSVPDRGMLLLGGSRLLSEDELRLQVEAPLVEGGPMLSAAVGYVRGDRFLNYEIHLTTPGGLDQRIFIESRHRLGLGDISLADVNGDGFADLTITGSAEHRGWVTRQWLYEQLDERFHWRPRVGD